jgi:hypothetical protein
MSAGLVLSVPDGSRELTDTHGACVVTSGPLQQPVPCVPIAIGDAGARTLETLNKPGEVEYRRELHDHVDVVTHDAHRQRLGTMTTCFLPQESVQEVADGCRDRRHPVQSGPGDMSV